MGIQVFVFFTTGTANDNQHLGQAKHKLDIGLPHTVTFFSPLSVKHGGTNASKALVKACREPYHKQTKHSVEEKKYGDFDRRPFIFKINTDAETNVILPRTATRGSCSGQHHFHTGLKSTPRTLRRFSYHQGNLITDFQAHR